MVKIVFWGFIDHALGTQTEAELNILAQKQREQPWCGSKAIKSTQQHP